MGSSNANNYRSSGQQQNLPNIMGMGKSDGMSNASSSNKLGVDLSANHDSHRVRKGQQNSTYTGPVNNFV